MLLLHVESDIASHLRESFLLGSVSLNLYSSAEACMFCRLPVMEAACRGSIGLYLFFVILHFTGSYLEE